MAGTLELPDWELTQLRWGPLWWLSGKEHAANAGDKDSIPDLGRAHMPRSN